MMIAVTGAAGFLGDSLLPLLFADGHEILQVGRRQGTDVRNWADVSRLPAAAVVVHMAAMSYVPDSYQRPREFYETNVTGTLNMLEYARMHGAKVIFISSYVYGTPEYLPIDERHPTRGFNPYAQSKLLGEELCFSYQRDFGLDVTILRPFNIYGTGQPAHFLLPKMVGQLRSGNTITLFDPRPRRDYVHVDDAAAAIRCSIVQAPAQDTAVYNIGSGTSYSIPEVIDILSRISGRRPVVEYLNQQRPNEILDTVCNNEKAKQALGWAPRVSLEDGLRRMMDETA